MTNKDKVNSYISELNYGINILQSINCTNIRFIVLKRMKENLKSLNDLISEDTIEEKKLVFNINKSE